MGSVHCYAAYLKENDDIALNAASMGWMNEWVEVILGGSILLPIATAYLGLTAVQSRHGRRQRFQPGASRVPEAVPELGVVRPGRGSDVVRPAVLRRDHVVAWRWASR